MSVFEITAYVTNAPAAAIADDDNDADANAGAVPLVIFFCS